MNVLTALRRIVRSVIIVMFAVLILVVFYQVVARYAFNAPPAWSEELARYLQVWIALLASALCIHQGMHLGVDYLIHGLPRRSRAIIAVVVNLLVTGFLVLLLVNGVHILEVAGVQTSPAMGVSMWYAYLAVPVGALLMLVENLVNFGAAVRDLRRAE